MELKKLVYEGYLHKSPPESKMHKDRWQKRFFRLWDDSTLEYYRTEKDLKPIKCGLDLKECFEVTNPKADLTKYFRKEYRYPFSLKMPGRMYYLIASSEDERKVWKEKICEQCVFDGDLCNPNTVIGMLVNSKYSPYSSGNSSSEQQQRSGSDSSGGRTTQPISINNNHHDRSSALSDDYEHAYNEVPPPRLAPNISTSFDNNIHSNNFQTLSTSFNDTFNASSDSISTNRSFHSDSRSFSSDIRSSIGRSVPSGDIEVFSGYIYNVPPPSNNNNRMKQLGTKSTPPKGGDIGYVKMDPRSPDSDGGGREDYIEMQGEREGGMMGPETPNEEYIQMVGENYMQMHSTSPPSSDFMPGRGVSVKEFRPVGSTLNRMPTMPTRSNTMQHPSAVSSKGLVNGRLGTSFEEVFDEIPVVDSTRRAMAAFTLDPPSVDRGAKPGPMIDRSTKPRSQHDSQDSQFSIDASGYKYFAGRNSGASEDYQNSLPTNDFLVTDCYQTPSSMSYYEDDELTETEYINNNTINDMNNNSSRTNSRYVNNNNNNNDNNNNNYNHVPTSPVPYSSHKSYDGELSYDRTDLYRDTNNNEPVLPPDDEHYTRLPLKPSCSTNTLPTNYHELPPKPAPFNGPPPVNVECYENFNLPRHGRNVDNNNTCFDDHVFEQRETYENVECQESDLTSEDLMYIDCSHDSTKISKVSPMYYDPPPPVKRGPGYVTIDPFKSNAAMNLR